MSTGIPGEIPLEDPPGDVHAVEDLVQTVAGVAHLLAVLGGDLAGPGAAAPGWLGADATAAAEQVAAVAALSREMGGAVTLATARLSAHADRLRDVRQEIEALRQEQDEDHASTWSRVYALEGLQAQFQFDRADARAIVEELRAAEAARGRRHAVLLEEITEDAARTAQALRDAVAVVGGTGRPGDGARSLAHLATLLPGWGDAELAARGQAVVAALGEGETGSDQVEEAAREALPFATTAAFANALLTGLGEEGVRELLVALGGDPASPGWAVTRLLSSAFGSAVAGSAPHDPVGTVIDASYATGQEHSVDPIVAGMVAVLAAGSTSGARGPRPVTVAAWTRQILLLEKPEGRRVGTSVLYRWPTELSDPAAVAVADLAERGSPGMAAALLSDPDVWQVALARSWEDGGSAWGELVQHAADEPGPAGDLAVVTGLRVIGNGLALDDPSEWTVNRATVSTVAGPLGGAVAAHVQIAVDALAVGMDGRLGQWQEVLRGLAYVSVDREAAARVEAALTSASSELPPSGTDDGTRAPLAVATVPAAFLAVQEYGQRLNHALDGFEARQRAQEFETWWNWTIRLPVTVGGEVIRRTPVGVALGLAEGYLAIGVGADGTWDNPSDRGLRFTSEDAADLMRSRWDLRTDVEALAQQAKAAFERTATALGVPTPPVSPDADPWEPVRDAAVGEAAGRAARKALREGRGLIQTGD